MMLPGTLMNSVSGSYRYIRVLPKKANPYFLSVGFSAFLRRAIFLNITSSIFAIVCLNLVFNMSHNPNLSKAIL